MTVSTSDALTKAFAVAEAIHHDQSVSSLLTLICVGDEWAATFDTIDPDDDGDWYENYCIGNYPHSSRSTDPAKAIMEAAVKLIEDLQLNIPV